MLGLIGHLIFRSTNIFFNYFISVSYLVKCPIEIQTKNSAQIQIHFKEKTTQPTDPDTPKPIVKSIAQKCSNHNSWKIYEMHLTAPSHRQLHGLDNAHQNTVETWHHDNPAIYVHDALYFLGYLFIVNKKVDKLGSGIDDIQDEYPREQKHKKDTQRYLLFAYLLLIFLNTDGDGTTQTLCDADVPKIYDVVDYCVWEVSIYDFDVRVADHNRQDLKCYQLGVGVGLVMNYLSQETAGIVDCFLAPFNPWLFCWFFQNDEEIQC